MKVIFFKVKISFIKRSGEMERNKEVDDSRIEMALIKARATLRELVKLHRIGKIRAEDVNARFSPQLDAIIEGLSDLRDKTGQIRLRGELHLLELERFRRSLGELEFGKFVELRWSRDNDSLLVDLHIIVLATGAEHFRASLHDGLLHEEGWDKLLIIVEE